MPQAITAEKQMIDKLEVWWMEIGVTVMLHMFFITYWRRLDNTALRPRNNRIAKESLPVFGAQGVISQDHHLIIPWVNSSPSPFRYWRIEKMRTLVDRSKEATIGAGVIAMWSSLFCCEASKLWNGREPKHVLKKLFHVLKKLFLAAKWNCRVSLFSVSFEEATERLTKDSAILSRTFRRQASEWTVCLDDEYYEDDNDHEWCWWWCWWRIWIVRSKKLNEFWKRKITSARSSKEQRGEMCLMYLFVNPARIGHCLSFSVCLDISRTPLELSWIYSHASGLKASLLTLTRNNAHCIILMCA